eukprot:TRINITY_DN2743_c0_g1_i1.p1 TRINITY_DN2743_c0_g1~~TRINITY_DN2743_c0_g1_i1.p1  ORF type:complete len:178 (+),score=3.27 TRINITY_DN2743_c0_g1_i1:170-703(+)
MTGDRRRLTATKGGGRRSVQCVGFPALTGCTALAVAAAGAVAQSLRATAPRAPSPPCCLMLFVVTPSYLRRGGIGVVSVAPARGGGTVRVRCAPGRRRGTGAQLFFERAVQPEDGWRHSLRTVSVSVSAKRFEMLAEGLRTTPNRHLWENPQPLCALRGDSAKKARRRSPRRFERRA